MKYHLDTIVFDSDKIESTLTHKDTLLAQWVIDTKDRNIEECLIKLGWTPPGKADVKCVFETDCPGKPYCALSHCPRFLEKH